MKMKLTSLMFGLLLAVGWTSSASAQALPEGGFTKRMGLPDVGINSGIVNAKKIATKPMMTMPTGESTQMNAPAQAPKRATGVSSAVHDKAYYQQFKYSWTGADGVTHDNVDPTEPATDPYQMYELLRFVYGNPNFPGPTYSAYTPSFEREDPVTYNAVAGGWDITAGTGGATINTKDITITVANYYASITSITVYNASSNAQLVNWDAATATANSDYYRQYSDGNYYYYYNLPTGWTTNPSNSFGMVDIGGDNSNVYAAYIASGASDPGTITIPYSALNGATEVRVVINATTDEGSTSTIQVNDGTTESLTTTVTTYTWNLTVAEMPEEGAFVQGTVVPPYEDGYTVLVVALNNDITIEPEPKPHLATNYTQKSEIIEYFTNNVEYVKLLTDGLRIGSETDHTSGTVFNCDGRYNKFFFLGKGQARKKAPRIIDRINNRWSTYDNTTYSYVTYQDYFCESVPFEEMFEQFSPTGGNEGDQITDFFSKLREGNVYNVEHDCASVIQLGHQFSLSGNDGTDYYPFSGLNFFCPDYRLLWWNTSYTYNSRSYTVDGRDMNPYERTNNDGSHGTAFVNESTNHSYWSAYFAQYNKTYAPKVGIYKITLNATAEFVGDSENPSHEPGNKNYKVTLTWVSSLDEMSGHPVTQIYTIYYFDNVTGERKKLVVEGVTNPTGVTTIEYLVDQEEHSYTIEYIVHGTPNDDDHPAFQAWSNRDNVVIPGWDDFVGLKLDHHESDFVITETERTNWYRNFLEVVNEDIFNGLTISKITGAGDDGVKMNEFNLYRFLYDEDQKPIAETKVATLTFDQASAERAHYTITYQNQEIEDYTLKYKNGDNTVTVANAYNRDKMEIPDEGWVRVKGNGDVVIWPSGFNVNFKSIIVKNGNTTLASWNADNQNTLPSSWIVSPGSKWEEYNLSTTGDKVGYMEGGGYIAIPNMVNDSHPNLTVDIVAYTEGSNTATIAVNDKSQTINSTLNKTYSWGSEDYPVSPSAAPRRAVVENTSSLVFTAKCNGSGTADDGAVWTVTSDAVAGEQDFDDARGIHYGSSNRTTGLVGYIQLATDQIPGTITKIVVEASRASNGTGYVSTTVGGNAFGGNAQTLTSSNAAYTFEGSATGPVVVRVFKNQSARYALYVKSITVYYETEGQDTPTEGGLLRMHLLMVDQLKANIPDDNSHPDAYGYVLRWEQPEDAANHKQSGTVRVDIQKTDCEVQSYYTLDQVDRDTKRDLTMDVITADVNFNLSESNDLLNYYYLQGAENYLPKPNEDFLTQLHRQDDFTYREMYENSPERDQVYPSGEHHYFDDSTPIRTGVYGDAKKFMSYAPSVTTWGIQRRYFEYDGLDNTYGAPIWKTAVGKVDLTSVDIERQRNKDNSVNWSDEGGAASLYMLNNINAIGKLPHTNLTKVEFEPYMYRIFVESENGLLRPYKVVPAVEGSATEGEHLAPKDGDLTEADKKGPLCVWSGYVKRNAEGEFIDDPENGVEFSTGTDQGQTTYIYHKNKVERTSGMQFDKNANNAKFGALDALAITGYDAQGNPIMRTSIPEEDLKVYVRFYYNVLGTAEGHTPWINMRTAGGSQSRVGNGSEASSGVTGIATAVNEIQYLGEIVSQTYYNVQGMVSDKPFDGVNIVVTRFGNGTTSVSKIVR